MSPTFSFLLSLVALLPSSLSVPVTPAGGFSLLPSANPLPPSPGGSWYDIPGTTLAIYAHEPYGPALPSLPDAVAAIRSARYSISASHRPNTQLPQRPRAWQTTSSNVRLSASAIFSHLGNYGQLSSALTGLEYLLSTPGQVGARKFTWVVSDDTLGIIILGEISAETGRGRTLAEESAASTATNTTTAAGGNASGSATSVTTSSRPSVSVTSVRLLSDETS